MHMYDNIIKALDSICGDELTIKKDLVGHPYIASKDDMSDFGSPAKNNAAVQKACSDSAVMSRYRSMRTGEDYGTPEGAKKAAETRRNRHGGYSREELDALARHNAMQKANWEELKGHGGSGFHHHPMYTGFRESAKLDTLIRGEKPGWKLDLSVRDDGKQHDVVEAGARAAKREMDAQRSVLERYMEGR